jgi:uncharacterized protein YqjF (DUF2071 family)
MRTTRLEARIANVLQHVMIPALDRERPWAMIVRESNLLFSSWPVNPEMLTPLVPSQFELDVFKGSAWITVEALEMSTVKIRGIPPLPRPIKDAQINIRTYVRYGGERGIFVISLDCPVTISNPLTRALFHLPFRTSAVGVRVEGNHYHCESTRTRRGQPIAQFAVAGTIGAAIQAVPPDTVDDFLLNQTLMFAALQNGTVLRGRVAHRPRTVNPIDARVEVNTLTSAEGIQVPDTPPLFHFSPGDDAMAWPLDPVARGSTPEVF